MRGTSRSSQSIYATTTAICAVGMVLHLAWMIWQWLSGPPSPDLYANHLSFILVVFLIFWTPIWLLGLLLILVVEFVIFGRKRVIPDMDNTCG
ncbi:MAG: hypothetical protein RSP_13080 [Rhodanobacter sp.]